MILSHIKQNFNLKNEDGEYFNDIFNSSKDGALRDKKLENKKDIVLKLTESIYLDLDPSEPIEKNLDKTQIIYEKPKISHSQMLQMMMRNFVETFKTKEQIFWHLEILGNIFCFVGEEAPKTNASIISNYSEKMYEKGLEIYQVILYLLPKLGFRENQSFLKLENAVMPVKLVLDEEDKQKLFRLAISHLSMSFEKIENLKKADFLLKVIEVFNQCIFSKPLIIKDDTWEFILFVLMGIFDSIIQKSKKIEPKVLEDLQHQLIMSLMNSWINSGMRDCNLWKKFSFYARNWQNVDLFLLKWKEVCLGLTKKVLRDLYNLPFIKVKVKPDQTPKDGAKGAFDSSSKQDYSFKASTFLLIIYEKQKSDKNDSQSSFSVNIHSKNHVFPENHDPDLFWANISSEQTVFLWHKFLHLFERHPCETFPYSPQNSTKFSTLLLKTIQEIVNEILKVGHGVSNKKLKNATRENKEFFLSFKTIEGIWSKAIQPRRIEQTQCFECLKKSGKSPNFLIKNADKNQNMGIEKNKVSEEFTTLNKSDFFASSMMKLGGTPEISFSKNDRKKEFLGHEIHKNFIPKQKSFKSSVKSLSIDPVYKSGVQENNKYIFCKHKVAKGDDILAIFSKWLFESGSSNQLGLEELNLLSIQILAKIFRKGRGPFKEEYLLKFYCLLLENIKKDDSSGFLKICVKLFEVNLPNTYCIMKEFILQFADRTFKSQPTIFLDVYSKFISRFVCSYLGRLKYIGEFEKKFDKYVYSLDYWINHVIECLKIWDKKEKNNCLHVVNWVFTIHNVNNRRFNSIVKKIFNSCKEKENNKQNKLIALKMMGLCFNIILSVGEIYHLKKLKADDGLNKEDVTDIKNSLVVFFEELEIFLKNFQIKAKLSKGETSSFSSKEKDFEKDKEKENEIILKISYLILQCIYVWLTLPIPVISEDQHNLAITLFLETFQNTAFKRLNDYSSLLLKNLMNNIGKSINFQNTILLSTAISSIEEIDPITSDSIKPSIFESFKDSQSVVINRDVIITFHLGDLSPNEDVVICIRNSQGKFIWQGELIYKLFPNKNYEPFSDIETFPFKTNAEIYENLRYCWKDKIEDHESQKEDSPGGIKKKEEEKKENNNENLKKMTLDEMIEEEFALEEEFEKKLEKIENLEKKDKKYSDSYYPCQFIQKQIEINSLPETRLLNITKLFLFHFGLLDIRNSLEMPNKVVFLENTKELWESLKELDRMPERSQIKVSCYYIENLYKHDLKISIFEEENYREYTDFIESISLFLDANSFKTGMYESVRNLQKKYTNMNYSSNMLFEIIYLQPQLSELSDKFQKNQNICILWNARTNNDKFDNKLPSFLQIFMDENPRSFIMITPLNTYLFSIKVFKITEIHEIKDIYVGPLISKMIITKESLPLLVNATILNISRKQNPTPIFEAQDQRNQKITKIREKFINKEKTENFLSILNLSSFVQSGVSDKKDISNLKNDVNSKTSQEKFNISLEKKTENFPNFQNSFIKKLSFRETSEKFKESFKKNEQFEFLIKEEAGDGEFKK